METRGRVHIARNDAEDEAPRGSRVHVHTECEIGIGRGPILAEGLALLSHLHEAVARADAMQRHGRLDRREAPVEIERAREVAAKRELEGERSR